MKAIYSVVCSLRILAYKKLGLIFIIGFALLTQSACASIRVKKKVLLNLRYTDLTTKESYLVGISNIEEDGFLTGLSIV